MSTPSPIVRPVAKSTPRTLIGTALVDIAFAAAVRSLVAIS